MAAFSYMALPLHVLVFPSSALRKRPEDGKLETTSAHRHGWVAVCLEHYILADGDTVPDAIEAFRAALEAEILLALDTGRTPLQDKPAAPARYHELWKTAVPLADPIFVVPPDDEETPLPAAEAARIAEAFAALPRSAEVRLNG